MNTRDGHFREGKAEGYGAHKLAVDVHGAAAHPLHDSSFSQRTAAEFGEDDGLLWAEIFEEAEDFDLELFDAIPLEDSATDTMEAWADVA